jgi:hypothetical protein
LTHHARQKGKTSGIDFDVLEKLADALGVNAALLLVHEPKGSGNADPPLWLGMKLRVPKGMGRIGSMVHGQMPEAPRIGDRRRLHLLG